MDTVESLIAKLGLDTSGFKEGLVESGEAVKGLNEKMEALQAGLAGGAMVEFVRSTLESAAQTKHFADNLNISTDSLQALTWAAKEHGASQEDVNRLWTSARTHLDQLREGQKGAEDAFHKLGLSAKDFIGLSLDQAVEKISQAYVENQDRVGALDGMQTILGRSGRLLTSTLIELGEQGFGTLTENAKKAHAVLSGDVLVDLERANRKWEEEMNLLKIGGAYVVDFVTRIGSFFGVVAAELVGLGEAILKGGPFSAAGRAAMHDTMMAAGEAVVKLVTLQDMFADSTKKVVAEETNLKAPLVESSELVAARARAEEQAAKAALDGLGHAAKLLEIKRQIEEHGEKLLALEVGSVEALKENAKIAELIALRDKEEVALADEKLERTVKDFEIKKEHLSLFQTLANLEKERQAIADRVVAKQKEGLDTTKQQGELDKVDKEIRDASYRLREAEVAAVKDLLSADAQRVENAKVFFEVLSKQKTEKEHLDELDQLLARNIDDLTEKERIRLNALIANTDQVKIQAEIMTILARAGGLVENLTKEDQERLAVLTGQTLEIKKQNADLEKQLGLVISIKTKYGTEQSKLTDAELEEKIRNLQGQIFNVGLSSNKDPWIQAAVLGPLKFNLASAQSEMNDRTFFRAQVDSSGLTGALGLHSAFDRDRLLGYLSGDAGAGGSLSGGGSAGSAGADVHGQLLGKVATTLSTIDQRLSATGFRTG